jgi:hypothetical protein
MKIYFQVRLALKIVVIARQKVSHCGGEAVRSWGATALDGFPGIKQLPSSGVPLSEELRLPRSVPEALPVSKTAFTQCAEGISFEDSEAWR